MSITTYCHRQCRFCYVGGTATPAHKSLEQISLELARAREVCDCDRIVFSGGEPTSHPGILHIMEMAQGLGFNRAELFSNGQKLRSREFVYELVCRGLRGAMISLHGSCADVHNPLVGERDFSYVLRGIETLLDAGVQVTVNTVATTANLEDIISIYQLIQNRFPNASNYRVTYPSIMGRLLKKTELIPSYEDVTRLIFSLLDDSNGVPLTCELIPLCLLGSRVDIAVEYHHAGGKELAFGGVGSQYNRVGGKPCLKCPLRDRCYGLQMDAVLKHGVPSSYGRFT